MNNDSTFEKLKHLKTLENTRMIYDLMTEINLRVDGYNSYNGSGGLKARIDRMISQLHMRFLRRRIR